MGLMRSFLSSFSRWLSTSVRRAHLDADLEHAAVYMKGRVLEVGNGRSGRRGRFLPPFEQAASWFFLDLFTSRYPHICADVQQLPFGDARFDTVVCLEVAEYVPAPSKAVAEIARVLEPSGLLIFSVPFIHRQDSPSDKWRWSPAGCRFQLEQAGFNIIEQYRQAHGLGVAANVIKYCADVVPCRYARICLGLVLAPLVWLLWRLDGPVAKMLPQLADFTTGTLIVARKEHPV
jgi:SAM-dependent methyltransferase